MTSDWNAAVREAAKAVDAVAEANAKYGYNGAYNWCRHAILALLRPESGDTKHLYMQDPPYVDDSKPHEREDTYDEYVAANPKLGVTPNKLFSAKTTSPEPSGFVSVPREPTEAMVTAGVAAFTNVRDIYAAMLAAAPASPSTAREELEAAAIERAAKVLECVQWSHLFNGHSTSAFYGCPVCRCSERNGHKSTCDLAAALTAARASALAPGKTDARQPIETVPDADERRVIAAAGHTSDCARMRNANAWCDCKASAQ